MGPIQTTNLDEFSAHPCACNRIPVTHYLKMSTVGMLSWIRRRCDATHRITLTACIHQVVISGVVFRSNCMGTEMVNTKSGFTVRKPAFAAETVHTLKDEL